MGVDSVKCLKYCRGSLMVKQMPEEHLKGVRFTSAAHSTKNAPRGVFCGATPACLVKKFLYVSFFLAVKNNTIVQDPSYCN